MTLRRIGLTAIGLAAIAGAIGCTDTPLPPAKAASFFQIQSGGCNVNGGFAIPAGEQPTTERYLGARVEDGEGASVDCSVSNHGGSFTIHGQVSQGSRSLTVIATVSPVDTGGFSGLGSVIHYDAGTGGLQSDGATCAFTVLPTQDVAAGRVWGNFVCSRTADPPATISSSSSVGTACDAQGNFVFENCDK